MLVECISKKAISTRLKRQTASATFRTSGFAYSLAKSYQKDLCSPHYLVAGLKSSALGFRLEAMKPSTIRRRASIFKCIWGPVSRMLLKLLYLPQAQEKILVASCYDVQLRRTFRDDLSSSMSIDGSTISQKKLRHVPSDAVVGACDKAAGR